MNDQLRKEQWIEEALASLEGVKRAEANPFLYTRIAQQLHNRQGVPYRVAALISRPVSIVAFSVLFLLINVFVVTRADSTLKETEQAAAEQLFAAEYAPSDPLSTELNAQR